ncbi:MAG: fumarylacetoacetate hydrolase family protein, partial [Actinobacteria bacterium]|nr:fumarylacetoacetate hydrolase family protein [Actinomycetota bacterium]
MRALFEGGPEAIERAAAKSAEGDGTPMADVHLMAPIRPNKFFHTSGNFVEHEEDSKQVGFSHPIKPGIVFFQNPDAIIGPDEAVVYPSHLTSELDYELELCVVIGKDGKHLTPEQAVDLVGGYTIFNDVTARDIQRREMSNGVFSFCKAIETFSPLGPWIVTPDELMNPRDLSMQLRVNGEIRQDSHSGRSLFSIPEIIAYHSPMGFRTGDLLSLGTVAGVAGFSTDAASLYLKPGDVIEAEIEGIGMLRNPVVSWDEAHGAP